MLRTWGKLLVVWMTIIGMLGWLSVASANAAASPLGLDPALETAVKDQLLLDARTPLTEDELRTLTELYAYTAGDIRSLQGLEAAAFLEELVLDGNPLDGIDAIAPLKRINFLSLMSTGTEGLEPLRGLTGVQKLLLSDNRISDLSPLAGMTQLTDLLIGHNAIEDLSALRGKPLTWITASHNKIRDIGVLAEIPSLETLYLDHNLIEDLSPLLRLPKLRTVALHDNPLNAQSQEILKQLEDKGVEIATVTDGRPRAISVYLDGKPVSFNKAPVLMDGTTMVQFRPLFEAFGLEVGWDGTTSTVTGKKDRMLIELVIGRASARLNGKEFPLAAAPSLLDGSTMVPLRFIGEATGRQVTWVEATQSVYIESNLTSANIDIAYSNDTVYVGETRDGQPHGKGTLTHQGILFYEGDFDTGTIEGSGKMYDVNNPASYYEGQFQNNRFHGEGKLVYDDGAYHVGPFVKGLREGYAKVYLKDGSLSFEGMFKEDARNGEGTGIYNREYKYVGSYVNDRFQGQGKLYHKNELLYDGIWNAGQQDYGKQYYDGKLSYDGTYRNDTPHGYGAFYDDSGKITYRGTVRNGKKTGVGILYYPNGERYVGEVYNGKADGQGMLKDASGKAKHEGSFKDDAIDPAPELTAKESGTLKKLLKRRADHQVVDGMNKNSMGLNAQQAAMFILLESEEHVKIFNALSTNAKIELLNEYTQEHWGDVLGVKECFTFIVYGKNAYAQSTISYQLPNEQATIKTFADGRPIFK